MELIYLIQDLREIKDLVAVYCNRQSTDRFLVGYPLSVNAECLALSLISMDACFDGICFCSADYIFRIELESQYLHDIHMDSHLCKNLFSEDDAWKAFLTYAKEQKYLTRIRDFSGKLIMSGVVVGYSIESVTIRKLHPNTTKGRVYQMNRNRIALMFGKVIRRPSKACKNASLRGD